MGQKELYKKTMSEAEIQISLIEGEIKKEIEGIREKLTKLQMSKMPYIQIYKNTAQMIGANTE